jgi:hypothetical protein
VGGVRRGAYGVGCTAWGVQKDRRWPQAGAPDTPSNSSENDLGKKILGLFLILTSNNHMSKKKFKTKNCAQSFGDAML